MSQTGIITAALLIAFLVYVTMKGELGKYGSVFYGADTNKTVAPSASSGSSSGSGSSGSGGSIISEVAPLALAALA